MSIPTKVSYNVTPGEVFAKRTFPPLSGTASL